jgi:hypothetical protein
VAVSTEYGSHPKEIALFVRGISQNLVWGQRGVSFIASDYILKSNGLGSGWNARSIYLLQNPEVLKEVGELLAKLIYFGLI